MTGLKGVARTFNDMESAKLGIGTLPKAFAFRQRYPAVLAAV